MPPGKKPVEERFWLYVEKCEGECWWWRGCLTYSGYGQIKNSGKMVRSHRLSYELHHPLTKPIDDIKLCVLHSCDNPKCVNPAHLSLGTHQDNMTDMANKGRATGASHPGEKNPNSKLNEQQVIEIRNRYANGGITLKQLSNEYGGSITTISSIITRKRWAHLQPPSPS